MVTANTDGIRFSKVPGQSQSPDHRALRTNYDFSAGGTIELFTDIGRQQQENALDVVISIYVDNAENNAAVSFLFPNTQYVLTVPPSSQGWYPVMMQGTRVDVSCTGGNGVCRVYFCNFLVPYYNWQQSGSASGFIFDGSGNLLVSDQGVEAILTAGIDVTDTTPGGTLVTVADTTPGGAGTVQVLAGAANIYKVIVSSSVAGRIGDSNTGANRGVAIQANVPIELETQSDVYVYVGAAAVISVSYITR